MSVTKPAPKKRGWPKGKPRGPRKPKIDPFKTRRTRRRRGPIKPTPHHLSPFYLRMTREEVLLLVDLLKNAIASM